jgi:hypothetical protein
MYMGYSRFSSASAISAASAPATSLGRPTR